MTTETPELFDGLHFVTVEEIATVLRLSKMTVYRMIKDRKVPSQKYGRSIRIPVADARALVRGEM